MSENFEPIRRTSQKVNARHDRKRSKQSKERTIARKQARNRKANR